MYIQTLEKLGYSFKVVYDGFAKILEVIIPGKKYPKLVVAATDGVVVLVVDDSSDSIVMVEQNRPTMITEENPNGATLELVAGRIDRKVLDPAEIARQEILEEVGIEVALEAIESVNSGVPLADAPGIITERLYLFVCHVQLDSEVLNNDQEFGLQEEGEITKRKIIPIKDFENGTIVLGDMKSFALIQWFLANRRK